MVPELCVLERGLWRLVGGWARGRQLRAGIGFTIDLFIGNLGFQADAEALAADQNDAKTDILTASVLSAVFGVGVLMTCKKTGDEAQTD